MELFAIVVLVLGLIGCSILRKHMRESKQLKLRGIIHEERMKAMENNLPLPETDDSKLIGLLGSQSEPSAGGLGALQASILWARLVSLCLGLAAFIGGIGISIAMYFTQADDMSDFWAMGLIPVFFGIGLLIFFGFSKSIASSLTTVES